MRKDGIKIGATRELGGDFGVDGARNVDRPAKEAVLNETITEKVAAAIALTMEK